MQSLLLNDVPRAAQAVGYPRSSPSARSMLVVQLAADLAPVAGADRCCGRVPGRAASCSSLRWARRGVLSGIAITRRARTKAPARASASTPGSRPRWRRARSPQFLDEYRCEPSARPRGSSCGSRAIMRRRASWRPSARRWPRRCCCSSASGCLHLPFPVLIASLVLFARMSAPGAAAPAIARSICGLCARFCGDRAAARHARAPDGRTASPASRSIGSELGSTQSRFEHQPGPRPAPRFR